jgi:YD repeat-containing protein
MQYDTKGQLTKWRWGTAPLTCPIGPPLSEDGNACPGFTATQAFTFAYDSAGNLKQMADSASSSTTTSSHVGNRLTSWGSTHYKYDLDGNMSSRRVGTDSTMFTWSPDNRLLKVKRGTDSTEYNYDAAGQLIRRKKQRRIERHFLWEGDQLVAELDSAATKRVAEYAYWPGIDQPLALVTGSRRSRRCGTMIRTPWGT